MASVNQGVELASLIITPGELQPSFDSATTQYNVDLTSDIETVIITAQPRVAGDTVSINGQTTTRRDISLGPVGSVTPVSIVVSESTSNSRTYIVLLNKATLAGNNSLQNLTVSPGTLAPTFNANTLSYTVNVANNVGSIAVSPTLDDPAATMTVDGQAATSGQAHSITLNDSGQSTTITVIVTAQSGTQKTYLITVNRGISGNNFLQSLTISPGTLDPPFSAGTVGYTMDVASNVTSVTVTPTLQDTTASLTVNGQPINSGQARIITLRGPGLSTFLNIVVTAQNGTRKTYSVDVFRPALSGNNKLSALTVAPGILDPAFNADTTRYTVDLATTVSSVTVTATLQDPSASMEVNGQGTSSGQARDITLGAPGSHTNIDLVVVAPNGRSKTYRITLERAAPASNNRLSALTVTPGILDPAFNPNTTKYTVDLATTVSSVTVTATLQEPSANMEVNGQGISSGQARDITLGAPGSRTDIELVVVAPNGSSRTYRITVERAAP
ncbi:MAG: cadherin-like beta sandwich domain-containing protein [Nitrospira sp.]